MLLAKKGIDECRYEQHGWHQQRHDIHAIRHETDERGVGDECAAPEAEHGHVEYLLYDAIPPVAVKQGDDSGHQGHHEAGQGFRAEVQTVVPVGFGCGALGKLYAPLHVADDGLGGVGGSRHGVGLRGGSLVKALAVPKRKERLGFLEEVRRLGIFHGLHLGDLSVADEDS